MSASENNQTGDIKALAGLVGMVFAAMSVVLFYHYGRLDDMAFAYWFAQDRWSTMRDIFIAQGRPLHGVLLAGLLFHVSEFADFTWLRLLAIVLACGFAIQIFFFLRQRGISAFAAMLFAVFVVVNPGMAAIVGWAICSTHILGYIVAFGIGWFALGRLKGEFSMSGGFAVEVGSCLRILLMLLPVFLLYQPAAAFVLLPAVFAWWLQDFEKSSRNRLLKTAAIYALAMIVYFVGHKLIVDVLWGLNTQSERSALATDPIGKLLFFLREPMGISLMSWSFFAGSLIRTVVVLLSMAVFVTFAIWQWNRRGWQVILDIGVLAAVVGLANAPLLVLQANYAPFRLLTFLYMLWAGLLIIIIWRYAAQWRCPCHQLRIWIPLAAALLFVVFSHETLRKGMAEPFAKEYQTYRYLFKTEFAEEIPVGLLWAIPDHNDLGNRVALRTIRYEFGTLSSGMEYVVPGMAFLLLAEIHGVTRPQHPRWTDLLAVRVVPLRTDRHWQAGDLPLIDGRMAFTGSPAVAAPAPVAPGEHFAIGEYESLYQGWSYSVWFGFFDLWTYPGVIHAGFGRIEMELERDGKIWLAHPELGRGWTTRERFPEVLFEEEQEWRRLPQRF